jgi:hypothetical protein
MNIGQKQTWWLDAVIFSGLVAAFFLELTGVSAHQWIGTFTGTLAAIHLTTHWSWVSAVSQRFFGRTSGRARLYFVVNSTIFAGFIAMTGTGLIISTWLNLSLSNASTWITVHITASIATLLLVVLKVGLHWRWISLTGRKAISRSTSIQRKPAFSTQTPGIRQVNRRQFLEVMGITGVASLLALTTALQSLQSEQSFASAVDTQTNSDSTAISDLTSTDALENGECTVRCNRGCSYPGHCPRYTDTNQNNRCDYGECL